MRERSILPEVRMEWRRSAGGAFAGVLVAGHLLGGRERERERDWGFWESLRMEKAKKALADGETTLPME